MDIHEGSTPMRSADLLFRWRKQKGAWGVEWSHYGSVMVKKTLKRPIRTARRLAAVIFLGADEFFLRSAELLHFAVPLPWHGVAMSQG